MRTRPLLWQKKKPERTPPCRHNWHDNQGIWLRIDQPCARPRFTQGICALMKGAERCQFGGGAGAAGRLGVIGPPGRGHPQSLGSGCSYTRDPPERPLPGDGVGVGCASLLHASTGRFQAMTTGRHIRTPTTPGGPPRRAAKETRRVFGDLPHPAPHPWCPGLLPHCHRRPHRHRHDRPRHHLAGTRPNRLLRRGRPGDRRFRRCRCTGRTATRPADRPLRPDPHADTHPPRPHHRSGFTADRGRERQSAPSDDGGRSAGGRHDAAARRTVVRPLVGAADRRAGGSAAHRLRPGIARQRAVLPDRPGPGHHGRSEQRPVVRHGAGHDPGGGWRTGLRRAAPPTAGTAERRRAGRSLRRPGFARCRPVSTSPWACTSAPCRSR